VETVTTHFPRARARQRKRERENGENQVYTLIVTFLQVRCNSITCSRAVKMALYDDSLETLVTSAERHNSPHKVDFMGKLATFLAGTFLFQSSTARSLVKSRLLYRDRSFARRLLSLQTNLSRSIISIIFAAVSASPLRLLVDTKRRRNALDSGSNE